MKRLIRRLTQNDYVFTVIARLLSFALGMVYSVLYSRYLHSELRGDVAVILNYSSFAMLILCFGINQGYPFFRKEKPQMAYKEYIDMIAAFFLLYCGVACIFVLLYQGDPAWRYTAVMIPLLFAVKELNYAVMIEKPYIRNVAAISLSVFDILLILIFYCFTEANFALAMVLIDAQKFRVEEYAMNHPAGAIGRALVMKVTDIMRTGEHLAKVGPEATVLDSLMAMTRAQGGSAVVADAEGKLLGIFTDGDFRRVMSEGGADRAEPPSNPSKPPSNPNKTLNDPSKTLNDPITLYMTPKPLFVRDDAYAAELLKIFERKRIDDLPVCDATGRVVGLVDIQDLPKMKVL